MSREWSVAVDAKTRLAQETEFMWVFWDRLSLVEEEREEITIVVSSQMKGPALSTIDTGVSLEVGRWRSRWVPKVGKVGDIPKGR